MSTDVLPPQLGFAPYTPVLDKAILWSAEGIETALRETLR